MHHVYKRLPNLAVCDLQLDSYKHANTVYAKANVTLNYFLLLKTSCYTPRISYEKASVCSTLLGEPMNGSNEWLFGTVALPLRAERSLKIFLLRARDGFPKQHMLRSRECEFVFNLHKACLTTEGFRLEEWTDSEEETSFPRTWSKS